MKNKEGEDDDDSSSQKTDFSDGSSSSHQEAFERKSFQVFLRFLGELFLSKFMPKKIISYCI